MIRHLPRKPTAANIDAAEAELLEGLSAEQGQPPVEPWTHVYWVCPQHSERLAQAITQALAPSDPQAVYGRMVA